MVTTAWSGAHEADLVGVLIDARKGIDEEAEALLDAARRGEAAENPDPQQDRSGAARHAAVADQDRQRKGQVRLDLHDLGARPATASPISSAGSPRACRHSPWLYPPDQMSDAPVRQLAAEITREKLFERLHQELPYHSTVETEAWKELRGGDIRIEQTIYVERESQRKIVIGKGGQTLKSIGEAARRGNRRDRRAQGAPVPVREGARGLGRRPGALPGHGAGVSQGVAC